MNDVSVGALKGVKESWSVFRGKEKRCQMENKQFKVTHTHDVKVEPVEETDWPTLIGVILFLLVLAAAFGSTQ